MMLIEKPAHVVVPTGKITPVSRVLVAGSVTSGTFLWSAIETEIGATTYNDYQWVPDFPWSDVVVTSDPADAVDSSQLPLLSRESGVTGEVQIRIANPTGSVGYRAQFSNSNSSSVKTTTGAVADSYLQYSSDIVLDLLGSAAPAAVFTAAGVRNQASWWPHSELTGVPFGPAAGGTGRNGVLVTPRHMLCARHYPLQVGSVVRFISSSNVVCDRTVVAQAAPALHEAVFYDLMIVVLNSDVDPSISPLPVAGDWLVSTASVSATTFNAAYQFSGIWMDQSKATCFCDVAAADYTTDFYSTEMWSGIDLTVQRPTTVVGSLPGDRDQLPAFDAFREDYKTVGVAGDSGSAILVPVSGGWAVATCLLLPGSGPFPHEGILNALIDAADSAAGISTGYTVTVAPDPTAP